MIAQQGGGEVGIQVTKHRILYTYLSKSFWDYRIPMGSPDWSLIFKEHVDNYVGGPDMHDSVW